MIFGECLMDKAEREYIPEIGYSQLAHECDGC